MTKEVFNNLKKMQMFSSLTADDISAFIGKIIVRRFKKGQTVLFEDDTNAYMYMLLSGRVKVIQILEDGRESIRAIHKTGDSFGELSLLDCKTSPAMVMAMEDTTAAIINRENFFTILYNQRKVLDNLLQMFCFRLRDSWERVQIANFKNASHRVIMMLQQQSCENGEQIPEGVLLKDRLTHQNMADLVGLNRETVTRVIDKLQKDGAITVRKDRKIVLHKNFIKLIPTI
ncbi:MAG TPA: Crp/Fnr family transcriptional regulator [Dissulfurispiraceae bacterium]|nr:Crp/Fnr family transcriptional regulator [Dissulfurispiraceae bacterium]